MSGQHTPCNGVSHGSEYPVQFTVRLVAVVWFIVPRQPLQDRHGSSGVRPLQRPQERCSDWGGETGSEQVSRVVGLER